MRIKSKIFIIIILFVILLIYYFLNKSLNIGIPCLFHEITGLYCPGCGVTRLVFSLLKLDFYRAFRANPLIFILLIISSIYLVIKFLLNKIWKINLTIPNYIYYIILVIVILFGILRNIPGFEFLIPSKMISLWLLFNTYIFFYNLNSSIKFDKIFV